MRLAEPEFAFRMARDLAPRQTAYQVDEVLSAVESLHTAIELPDSRFEHVSKAGAPQLIADNACGHEFVLGPATSADWRTMDLAQLRVSGSVKGKLECEGKGANVLGDPRTALTWLVNELSQLRHLPESRASGHHRNLPETDAGCSGRYGMGRLRRARRSYGELRRVIGAASVMGSHRGARSDTQS